MFWQGPSRNPEILLQTDARFPQKVGISIVPEPPRRQCKSCAHIKCFLDILNLFKSELVWVQNNVRGNPFLKTAKLEVF